MNRHRDIQALNRVLRKENQHIAQMKLYSDEQQQNALSFKGKIMKNSNKYMKKMEKADDMIRTAKEINTAMLDKNKKMLSKMEKGTGTNNQAQSSEKKSYLRGDKLAKSTPKQRKYKYDSYDKHLCENRSKKRAQHESQIDKLGQSKIDLNPQRDPILLSSGSIGNSLYLIDHLVVKKYFQEKLIFFKQDIRAEVIYKIMAPFYQLCGLQLPVPLIKKYKNCLYFGQNNKRKPIAYEGFLIFHNEKLYYGQLYNEKKNGKGTQIDFTNSSVYMGNFEGGKKNGDFTVIKPHETYKGQVKRGLYHGFGQLTTEFSTYKGYFFEGMRHGRGQEQFTSGLTISGEFVKNKFSNQAAQLSQRDMMQTGSDKNSFVSRLRQSNLDLSFKENANQKNSLSSRATNSEYLNVQMKCDKNVQFEPCVNPAKNYQEYHYEFGEEDIDEDPIDQMNTKMGNSFRIKECSKTFTTCLKKRTDSQDYPLLHHYK